MITAFIDQPSGTLREVIANISEPIASLLNIVCDQLQGKSSKASASTHVTPAALAEAFLQVQKKRST
jgi:hypothetical protein